ncbi:MAG: hypothetical protein WDW36_004127 [Sanguina aurantia]
MQNAPMPAPVVYQAITDLLQFDRNPRLNLGSFVTTYMDPEANQLIQDTLNINFADSEVYPSSTEIEKRCVHILGDLFNVPDAGQAHGTSTVGSSEGCLLGGLNMKKRWADKRKAAGLSTDSPNMVISYADQVVWEKFCAYFDVEARHCCLEEGRYLMTAGQVAALCDANTIGVVAIFGSTYTGGLEDVEGMGRVLDELQSSEGLDIPIHVDGASGGMIAPFLFPAIKWDFRVPRVLSISVSGHKYGFVYPGVGWLLYRSSESMHASLRFHMAYLGSDQQSLTFNFSRPACFVIAQYYNFLRMGRSGYRQVCQNTMSVACKLAEALDGIGRFRLLNDPRSCPSLPLVAFTLKKQCDEVEGGGLVCRQTFSEFDLSDKLQESGWMVPAYRMPPNLRETMTCMRVVVRLDMSMSTMQQLVTHIKAALVWLDAHFKHISADDKAHITRAVNPHRTPSNLSDLKKAHGAC